MKYLNIIFVVLISVVFCSPAGARSGCCSHHGGVCGNYCCDGTRLSAICGGHYDSCDSSHLYLCYAQYSCQSAGGYWYESTCNTRPQLQCRYDNLPGCTTLVNCSNVGGYWYDNMCNNNPQAQCRFDNLDGCTNPTDCQNIGGYWFNNLCNETPQVQCRFNNLSGCVNQEECNDAGGYWYDNQCHAQPQPTLNPGGHNAAPSHALSVVIFPTSVTPSNNTVQVGACNDIMIQPTLSVPSADFDRTATLIMYIYIPDAGFGMNVPSKTKILTSETKFDLLSHAIDFSDSAGLNFTIYYGYVIGSTIKYNAYSIVVGASCNNAVPDCGSISDTSSCNTVAGCTWQAFPSPGSCILDCLPYTSPTECQNAFDGACKWNTLFGVCSPK